MNNSEQIADILEKTADIIYTKGLFKGSYYNPSTGSSCALNALCLAATGESAYTLERRDKLTFVEEIEEKYITPNLPSPFTSIPHWNDSPATTQTEVEEFFKKCAKDIRNK